MYEMMILRFFLHFYPRSPCSLRVCAVLHIHDFQRASCILFAFLTSSRRPCPSDPLATWRTIGDRTRRLAGYLPINNKTKINLFIFKKVKFSRKVTLLK